MRISDWSSDVCSSDLCMVDPEFTPWHVKGAQCFECLYGHVVKGRAWSTGFRDQFQPVFIGYFLSFFIVVIYHQLRNGQVQIIPKPVLYIRSKRCFIKDRWQPLADIVPVQPLKLGCHSPRPTLG